MNRYQRNPRILYTASTYSRKPEKNNGKNHFINTRFLVIVLILLFGVFLVSRISFFQINTIEISGDKSERIEKEINSLRSKGLLSREVSYKISEIESDPKVEKLSCQKGLPETLRCKIELRKASIFWQSNKIIYELDNNGVIFGKTNSAEGDLVITDNRNAEVIIGQQIIGPRILEIYLESLKKTKELGYTGLKLSVSESYYQFQLTTSGIDSKKLTWKPKNPVNILMTTSYPVDDQLKIVTKLIQAKNNNINSTIDVRVPGFAYTK